MVNIPLSISWNIKFPNLFLFFMAFGLLTGTVLSLMEGLLKILRFKSSSLVFDSLVRTIFYFVALWLILNIIKNLLNDYSYLFISGYMATPSNTRNFDIIILTYTLFMIFIVSFINEMVSKNSPGFTMPLILGKYRFPREENRLFIFLDLKGSTHLAEELGHLKYSSFIQESIMEVNQVAKKFKAHIYQYIGDEIVITWKLEHFNTLNSIKFLFALNQRLKKKEKQFNSHYGSIPVFRAGIHEGIVTAIEIGDLKREIAFHGDTMNVCSRIQGLCKIFNRKILISEQVNQNKEISQNFKVTPLGSQILEGRKHSVEVFAVE
ncbi:adenylate/guanylate cyclase domain-containing protein [Salegentibacter sp. 24]|uniref:adenylate/guanylate cyclase domain-containing protein n=1 Tax=Salegentibacter sp. 24 TaxID=2183986 RepID=UPI001FB7B704|nr:adenylate/guanylate cyclase domain-containing protein [Salegentibacter sp. 24]